MALVACMALCSLPVPLTIPVIPAHTPLPAICARKLQRLLIWESASNGRPKTSARRPIFRKAGGCLPWRKSGNFAKPARNPWKKKMAPSGLYSPRKNGNSVSFLYPMGSRSAREFGIAGSDGCYLKVIILNPLLKAPGRDGYYSWEELGETDPGQRKYPVRLVKE